MIIFEQNDKLFSVINPAQQCQIICQFKLHVKWIYIKEKGQSRYCTRGEEDKNTEGKYNGFWHKCRTFECFLETDLVRSFLCVLFQIIV